MPNTKAAKRSAMFIKEQVERLQKLISQGGSHCFHWGYSRKRYFPHVSSGPSNYWIVYSGASNHMMGDMIGVCLVLVLHVHIITRFILIMVLCRLLELGKYAF